MFTSDLYEDDVISANPGESFGVGSTFKLSELITAVRSFVRGEGRDASPRVQWFSDGVSCKLLRTQGGGWKSGKLRFRLEFVPDEPDPSIVPSEPQSPLADLRSQLDTQ